MSKAGSVYHVHFADYMEGDQDQYFSSLAAVFERLTPEQIGCNLKSLYAMGVAKGWVYTGLRCTIRKYPVTQKRQSKKEVQNA